MTICGEADLDEYRHARPADARGPVFAPDAPADAAEPAGFNTAATLTAPQPRSTGEVPLNVVGEVRDPAQVGRARSAESYRKLLDAKRIHDPQNLFRAGFAVEPVRS